MPNMTLSGYEFDLDPAVVKGLDADSLLREKATATADTLTSSILFQWSSVAAGVEVVLEWQRMDAAVWNELQAMVENVSEVTFNPQIGETTFEVVPVRLEAQGRDSSGMKQVRLTLNVRSEN